ncbi:MAG: hypothetical protein ACI9HK_003013 [Pirellulaceae bacterium]|jgi:hypothetical protein
MSPRSPEMSRRDWFRLRIPDEANRALGNDSPKTQAVEQPVNHGGMDLSELPPVHEAYLSPDEIEVLFSDIEYFGEQVLVMTSARAAPTQVAGPALKLAKQSLLAGSLPKVQIRYQWRGAKWIDTIQRTSDGYRIIRIAHTGMT